MFLKTHSPTERLRIWREIRQKDYLSAEDLVKEFSDIKILSRYLDYYTPKSWPDPFEIVSEGYFCQTGVTILLTATLINKNFITSDELCFPVISNNINGDSGIVLLDDNNVYNFTSGKIESWEFVQDNATVFQTHRLDKKKLSY
mgnify:CR=1 FL=1|jgi:hypothetical protein|tara:strand:+ start:2106 stop:2537 length:432 start_codon:yes stop_codon:yes gene_type:complete